MMHVNLKKKKLRNEEFLRFALKQEKRVDNIFQKTSCDQALYIDFAKFKKIPLIVIRHFDLFFTFYEYSYLKIGKLSSIAVLKSLTSIGYTENKFFVFTEEIILLTFALRHFCKDTERLESLSKMKFKKLLSLDTKDFVLIFDRKLYN